MPDITGKASTPDGSITVEAAPGGGLRAVHLTRAALAQGGQRLAAAIMAVATTATAQANQAMAHTLGPKAETILPTLGITPGEAEDEDFGDRGVMRR